MTVLLGYPRWFFINPALYFIQRLTNDELYLSISSCQESTELLAEECIVQEIIWLSCRSFTKLSKQTSSWYWLQTFGPYAMKKTKPYTHDDDFVHSHTCELEIRAQKGSLASHNQIQLKYSRVSTKSLVSTHFVPVLEHWRTRGPLFQFMELKLCMKPTLER